MLKRSDSSNTEAHSGVKNTGERISGKLDGGELATQKSTAVFTIPNILSLIRIALIPVIVWLYMFKHSTEWTLLLLLVSGITDTVDGYTARRFGMVTNLGKVLDPIADKLTQTVVILCLAIRITAMRYLLFTLIVKELAMAVTGLI